MVELEAYEGELGRELEGVINHFEDVDGEISGLPPVKRRTRFVEWLKK